MNSIRCTAFILDSTILKMVLTPMSVMELSIAVVSIIGACGACLHGSKCTSCKVGCSGCELERSVSSSGPVVAEEPSLPEQLSTDADYTRRELSHDIR